MHSFPCGDPTSIFLCSSPVLPTRHPEVRSENAVMVQMLLAAALDSSLHQKESLALSIAVDSCVKNRVFDHGHRNHRSQRHRRRTPFTLTTIACSFSLTKSIARCMFAAGSSFRWKLPALVVRTDVRVAAFFPHTHPLNHAHQTAATTYIKD